MTLNPRQAREQPDTLYKHWGNAQNEKLLKNIALLLGLLSAVAIIFDWYPLTMFLSFPFCIIWIYCAWLRTEPQLKWVNLIFLFI